ncbi:hypothetical protein H5410_051271 [Solanum commersonii]|uniref:Uncharacterized protein n=1 Tax=Solanum commersonii TaxID=4109 RepID=A0A9J5X018_SOLCO|nr:hypothetical protein H5410_051271 [Solanum commersonii]
MYNKEHNKNFDEVYNEFPYIAMIIQIYLMTSQFFYQILQYLSHWLYIISINYPSSLIPYNNVIIMTKA